MRIEFKDDERDRIIRMAWEDRTSYEAIRLQFGLTPNDLVAHMRTWLERRAFERWRRRTTVQGHLKHEVLRPFTVGAFKSRMQRLDGTIYRRK